ncbi:MAG: 4-oxalocrotonate tautomerase, partial [Janthinobacterium sp.]
LSQLTAQLLHKAPELTSVAISHLDAAHWFVGGPSLQAQGKASFFLDILISDETNTAAEKAAYIAAVFAAMQQYLGAVHDVSYIHVHDARQAAWGYGGLTQQFRAVRKALQQP